MSTKIYDAYKVRRKDQIWALLSEIKARGKANVRAKLRRVYWEAVRDMSPESDEYKKELAKCMNAGNPQMRGNIAAMRLHLVSEEFRKAVKEQNGKPTRDYHDLSVSVGVHIHKSGFYLRVFDDTMSCLHGVLDFVRKHPKVRDYHYQNSTDRPESITARHWRERCQVWDEICTSDGILSCDFVVDICDNKDFWLYDPYFSMMQTYLKRPPKLPTFESVLARKLRGTRVYHNHKLVRAFKEVIAEPGCIRASPDGVLIRKVGPEIWEATRKGETQRFPTLDGAFAWVWVEYLPSWLKKEYEKAQRIPRNLCIVEDPACTALDRKKTTSIVSR